MPDATNTTARLATIDQLLATTIPLFLNPLPTRRALREMLNRAGVPRFKSNPLAKRGGGIPYYSVSGVEKFMRQHTLARIPGGRN
jgi:hypothetical protein